MTHIPEDICKRAEALADQWISRGHHDNAALAADVAQALMEERERLATILKDPAAVRVNYHRGDIACQALIEEATAAERERCARIEAASSALQDALDEAWRWNGIECIPDTEAQMAIAKAQRALREAIRSSDKIETAT